MQEKIRLKITCNSPPPCSGAIHPNEYSNSGCPVISSLTSSTEAKQVPPGLVSHVPDCELSGQWPSQKHCSVRAGIIKKNSYNFSVLLKLHIFMKKYHKSSFF